MTAPRVSIVIPAKDEVSTIIPALRRLDDAVSLPHEILVIVDSGGDRTGEAAAPQLALQPAARVLVQTYGPGPANAIRYGFDQAVAPCVVVTMADGSDDVRIIDDLVRLVERGCAIAAASRYMAGGAQLGGPRFKKFLAYAAGASLHYLAGVGTRDATNSFKAYETAFVRDVGITSRDGFEIGLELVAKARRARRPIAEIPTIWLDRHLGISTFQLGKWLPMYLRWWRFAFGRALSIEEIVVRSSRTSDGPA